MIDVAVLAGSLASFLLPRLGLLLGSAADTAAKDLGEGVAGPLKSLWERLWNRAEADPATAEIVRDAAERPEDDRAMAALSLVLERLLRDDPALSKDVEVFLDGVVDVSGDSNVVQTGKYNINIGSGSDITIGDQHRR